MKPSMLPNKIVSKKSLSFLGKLSNKIYCNRPVSVHERCLGKTNYIIFYKSDTSQNKKNRLSVSHY